ncbi:MAG: hypothetical protein ACYTG6_02135, partial [Planctomycetota bacterium]
MTTPTPVPAPMPARRREGLGLFLGLIGLCVLVVASQWLEERSHARELVAREDGALTRLEQVIAAQATYRARQGRYGWLEELAVAGLLQGLPVVEEGEGTHVRADGYRIDVLLPRASLGADVVEIGPSWEGQADLSLARKHFAAVARPLEPGVTGWRSWYLDERGELFLNEG